MREETWLFQRVGTSADGVPLYKQAPYVLIHDGSADAVLEPVGQVSMSLVRKFEFVDSIERILQADAARVIEQARIAAEQREKEKQRAERLRALA